jgi:hypothetical protein
MRRGSGTKKGVGTFGSSACTSTSAWTGTRGRPARD